MFLPLLFKLYYPTSDFKVLKNKNVSKQQKATDKTYY
jgi:hypothetical protein